MPDPFSFSNKESGGPSVNDSVRNTSSDSNICMTPGCIVAASELINSMDQTVDPCTDFYQFACGGFIAETFVPDHQNRVSSLSIINEEMNKRLRKILEAEAHSTEPNVFEHVKNFFHSCMDKETIEKSSFNDIKEIVAKVGGWPVIEGKNWDGKNYKWHDFSSKAYNEGFDTNIMISIGIRPDLKNSLTNILYIDEPRLGLRRQYLIKGFDDKFVQAYYNYMVQTAVFLGADENDAKEEMKEALQVELQLAEMSLPAEEKINKTAFYNPMALGEVQKLYPEFPWIKHISESLGVTVDENEVVNVPVPKYITDFQSYISTIPTRAQANYIVWRIVQSAMPYLNDEALNIQLTYDKVFWGITQKAPRWEICVESTARSLDIAVGSMYIRKYFNLDAKDVADKMVENIRAEFILMLDELDWMDKKTKARARKKADQITPFVAFPQEFLDDKLINEFYEGIDLTKESYLKNILRLKKFFLENDVKDFRKPINNKSWKRHENATKVGAWYNEGQNSINIPAGILDGVAFNADRPLYMNYGAIGHIVGHEITHGFDNQGSQFDGDGNLVDWWEPETLRRYQEKSQCMIDQYGNYSVEVEGETLNLNGVITLGENIADNGGIKEAFRAYERIVSKSGPEPILPGLGFSQRQLMWLSTARCNCKVQKPALLRDQVLTDTHSPGLFRINGAFANMPEFARDWGCPAGSMMNPNKKCSVW